MANVQGPEFCGLISPKPGAATDADLSRFSDWRNVQDLWLNRSPMTDAGLVNLRSARHLSQVHLAGTSITDEGLRHLEGATTSIRWICRTRRLPTPDSSICATWSPSFTWI